MFYGSILMQFLSLFSQGIALSDALHNSKFAARLHHNFREITVKNFENWRKSLCAQLRIDS